jgi:hypothetical protein
LIRHNRALCAIAPDDCAVRLMASPERPGSGFVVYWGGAVVMMAVFAILAAIKGYFGFAALFVAVGVFAALFLIRAFRRSAP